MKRSISPIITAVPSVPKSHLLTETLDHSIKELCAKEPKFQTILTELGYPETHARPRGYTTLLRTIVGQQLSVKSAVSIWAKLEARLGPGCPASELLAQTDTTLRACGLSRQKQEYARSLAKMIESKELDLDSLPEDDEEAIQLLTKIKGIGRWSAEIYLLFAEGRPDIWPAGDLAVRIAIGQIMGLEKKPSEKKIREVAEEWKPYRGVAAVFAWHKYMGSTL